MTDIRNKRETVTTDPPKLKNTEILWLQTHMLTNPTTEM